MATKRYKRDFKALEQRRKKAAQLLAKGIKQAEVARKLGVSRQSVSVWAKAQAVDQQAWRRKPLGSQPGLEQAQRRWLCRLLLRGAQANGFATDVWTLRRIGQLMEREFGISYGKTNVWLLLKSMGFSCQRPAGRASQRNEDAIGQWQRTRWPMLKKKRVEREESSFSSTRAA
jgi:transposase